MDYDDGGNPPRQVIDRWLDLVDSTFSDCFESNDDNLPTIAVHCVAGLGRAPVLVALALIELGMTPLDSIEFIRKRRRGAFNSKQIKFLDTYKRRKLKSFVLKSAVLKLFTKKTPPPVGMAAAPF